MRKRLTRRLARLGAPLALMATLSLPGELNWHYRRSRRTGPHRYQESFFDGRARILQDGCEIWWRDSAQAGPTYTKDWAWYGDAGGQIDVRMKRIRIVCIPPARRGADPAHV
jgi:hypothetical protein